MKGLNRERGFSNSIGPSINDDKLYLNYIALARCIGGMEHNGKIKHPSISQVCSAYKLYDTSSNVTAGKEGSTHKHLKAIFRVENVITGEVTEVKGGIGLKDLIDINPSNVTFYIKNKKPYKGTYLISRIDRYKDLKTSRMQAVTVTNINTEEVKEFIQLKAAAQYIGISSPTLRNRIKNNIIVDNLKVKYID